MTLGRLRLIIFGNDVESDIYGEEQTTAVSVPSSLRMPLGPREKKSPLRRQYLIFFSIDMSSWRLKGENRLPLFFTLML